MELLKKYYEYVLPNTECPVTFHRWSFLTCVAASLGRNFYLPFGHKLIYPNMLVKLIGAPATRKSTAIDIASNLLKTSGYLNVVGGRTSKEKFLEDLSENFKFLQPDNEADDCLMDLDFDIDDNNAFKTSEVLIAAGEFQNFLGLGNAEFASILGDLYDNLSSYPVRLKTGKSFEIANPTISILGGNTQTGLAQCLPAELLGQGFMSRLLLIFSQPTNKKIAFPETPSNSQTQFLLDAMKEIRETCQGICTLTDEAKEFLQEVYESFPKHPDYRFQHYNGRRFTHLLKVCIAIAACDLSRIITLEHAKYANTILYQAELNMPAALAEFGKSFHAEIMGKILTELEAAERPMKLSELHKVVHQDLNGGVIELQKIMTSLEDVEKVQRVGGEWLAKKVVGESALKYVDTDLLEEYHGIP